MILNNNNCDIFNTADDAFRRFYDLINENGIETNVGTKAIYNVGFLILDPSRNCINTEWRKWNKKYAEREWAWYLSCNPSVEEIKKYAPIWDNMHGGDNIVNSNYGYQWTRNGQLKKCIEQLKNNHNSRQAWISIFDGKEKNLYTYDTPCTLSVGFDINPGTPNMLNMTIIMRSNDLIYGFCNDQYCFSELQKMVADELGLAVGTYYHFAHDLHIYEKHYSMKKNYYERLKLLEECQD
jgi:thymidylate synthase